MRDRNFPMALKDRPRSPYRRMTMAQRVLDLLRYRLRNVGDTDITGAELIDELESVAEDLDASREEKLTAAAYLVLATKDEREAQRDNGWPHTFGHAARAASIALSYAESYEPGSIVNAWV